jgi:uncharacterized protein (DUF3084 family)
MTYLIGLILVLLLLAGVIAWAGDRLGTWAGRNRISIMGARPKRTGQLIGILAGLLIMISTIGVLAFAFENAAQTILNAQATARELSRLQDQERDLSRQVDRLAGELDTLAGELTTARETINNAEAARDDALASRDAAARERDALQADADALAGELRALRDELERVEGEFGRVQRELEAASEARDAALSERDAAVSEVGVAREQVNQLQGIIEVLEQESRSLSDEAESLRQANADLAASNEQLAQRNARLENLNATLEGRIEDASARAATLQGQVEELTAQLEQQSRRLRDVQAEFERASSGDVTFETGELIYSGSIDAETLQDAQLQLAEFVQQASELTARRGAGAVALRPDQQAILIDAVLQTPESDLVRFLSPNNQFSPVEVEVVIEAFENEIVVERGRLLVATNLHLGTADRPVSQNDLRGAISSLKGDALRTLRREGLDEFQLPRYPTLTEESFASLLLRRTGPVHLGIVVLEDVYRSGPARLELTVLD